MNKMQFVAEAARKTDYTIKETGDVLDALLATVSEELQKGGKIHISGFGTMEIKERAPRRARNPKTGESFMLDGRKYVQFTPCRELKEKVK